MKLVFVENIKHVDVTYFSISTICNLSSLDSLNQTLLENDFLKFAFLIAQRYQGTNIQKISMQSFIRILSPLNCKATTEQLQELIDMGLIQILSHCLKSDDVDVSYWCVSIIHELISKS